MEPWRWSPYIAKGSCVVFDFRVLDCAPQWEETARKGPVMEQVSGQTALRVYVGGADINTLKDGRHAAALEVASGYEQALSRLHRDDDVARAWYAARLADARVIAGLPAVAPAPREQEQRVARQ